MDTQELPHLNIHTIGIVPDTTAAWLMETVPWKTIQVPKLHRVERFTTGSGWGRNSWGEYYKGDSVIRSYVVVPEELAAEYNLRLVYADREMVVLRGAAPEFTRPRGWNHPGVNCFYRWCGVDVGA